MIAIISPAKTIDFETPSLTDTSSCPEFLDYSQNLINKLRTLSESKLCSLMSISSKLAALNRQRYKDWSLPFTASNSKQAIMAFKGDVYTGFTFDKYKEKDFAYAQRHLRILSGLYGLLRPLDLIQPYRLEMGTKLATPEGKDLYDFWSSTLTNALNEAVKSSGVQILINLASKEYYKSLENEKSKMNIQRFKGLGEMNPEELWNTTLNPETRNLLKVQYSKDNQKDQKLIHTLMGSDVGLRKDFIISNAINVQNLDV